MNEPHILDLCRAGQFDEAQQQLEAMAAKVAADPKDFALGCACDDLRACLHYYMDRSRSQDKAPDTLRAT